MNYPTQSEETMLRAVLAGVAEEALRSGMGTGAFHGFVCSARARKSSIRRRGVGSVPCMTVSYTVRSDGEVVQAGTFWEIGGC
jgi:hypothetical protein